MYRHADEHWRDEPEDVQPPEVPLQGEGKRWKPTPVPLALIAACFAVGTQFFGLFLLAWGVAPTSAGCGPGRAATMVGMQLPISASVGFLIGGVGYVMLAEAGATQLRRRSYLLIFGALYLLGTIPMLVSAGLFGSCFDF